MIATPLPHQQPALDGGNDLPWLRNAADANSWLHALAKPDHFSHTTAAPQRSAPSTSSSSSRSSSSLKTRFRLPEHASRWPSARSEAQPWDAAWLAHNSDDETNDEEEEDDEEAAAATSSSATRRIGATRSAQQHDVPLRRAVLDNVVPTPRAGEQHVQQQRVRRSRTFDATSRSTQSVPPSPSSAASLPRRRRRHTRATSAPNEEDAAPLPAAPLHVDTALPLALPPRSICVASTTTSSAAPSMPFWRRTDAPSHAELEAPMLAHATSFSLQRSNSVVSLASTGAESDGSWHGDVGDVDPDAQLAAANARRQAVALEHSVFNRASLAPKPRTYSSSSGSSDDDDGRAISQYAGSFALTLGGLLDLSILSAGTRGSKATSRPRRFRSNTEPHSFSNKIDASQPLTMNRRSSSADGTPYCYSTPASLRAEGRSLRATSSTTGPSAAPSSLARLGSWLLGTPEIDEEADAEEYDGRLARRRRSLLPEEPLPSPSTSVLPLPSLLSRSSSVASLGSLARLPALTQDTSASSSSSESEDEADDAEAHEDMARVRHAWRTHGAQPGAGAVKMATSLRRIRLSNKSIQRRGAPSCLSFTPMSSVTAQDKPLVATPGPVSPLWSEDAEHSVEDAQLPYTRSWVSLLGL